jgi:molybdopterin-biosynthesis enzyme MoeA-like protein
MESIFETSIAPKMKSVFGVKARFEATLQVRGVGEGTLAPSLAELKRKNPDVYIKSHPKGHINGRLSIEMHIAASGREAQLVKSSVDSVAKALEDIVTSHGGEVARIE